jgi:hypothetical protein
MNVPWLTLLRFLCVVLIGLQSAVGIGAYWLTGSCGECFNLIFFYETIIFFKPQTKYDISLNFLDQIRFLKNC